MEAKMIAEQTTEATFFDTPMSFEFDPQKSASNKAKHGVDFVEAQSLWLSKTIEVNAKDAADKRYLVIGKIGKQYWSAVITYRGMTRRIISVRKSTPNEIEAYAKNVP